MSSGFNIQREILPNAYLISVPTFEDNRGTFSKIYNEDEFSKIGLKFNYKEEFISKSDKNVIRGMHFQIPPYNHDKIIWCSKGSVVDVLLDLRNGDNYGKVESLCLQEGDNNLLYIPSGIAHGFKSLENNSELIYKTSSIYSAEHDKGILWNSFNFNWDIEDDPIISSRDLKHIIFEKFTTPF